eukprot:1319623-Amorphochlora_amoeboformis.AAC.2
MEVGCGHETGVIRKFHPTTALLMLYSPQKVHHHSSLRWQDINLVGGYERGIPYGSVLEARGLSAGELEQARVESRRHIEENGEECNKAEDWVRDTVSGYWLPKCMFGYQILRVRRLNELFFMFMNWYSRGCWTRNWVGNAE